MLIDKINTLRVDTSSEPFVEWASLVGRFSFQYGRTSGHQADEDVGGTKQS